MLPVPNAMTLVLELLELNAFAVNTLLLRSNVPLVNVTVAEQVVFSANCSVPLGDSIVIGGTNVAVLTSKICVVP